MDNFKLASKLKLRFQTNKGLLSVENLWDLSLLELDELAVSLEIQHKESGKKSFIVKTSSKDRIAKLRFDIVLDILNTKDEESQAALAEIERKANNEKILRIIADKKDESLKVKSIKQLEAMLQ